jgi:PKD repeat protein
VTGPGGSNTRTQSNYITVSTGSDTTAPSATANLVATVSGSTSVNLTWSAATDNVGVVQYRIERCQGSTSCTSFSQIGTASATSYANTGLTASTIYRYRVRAADAAGNLGAYSSVVTVTTASSSDTTRPSQTVGLAATVAGSSAVNLAWSAATDNVGVTGYRVERCQGSSCTNFAQIATPAGTTYASTGLTPTTTYRYRVRAADAAGNLGTYSAIVSATTTVAAPTAAFTATPVSGAAPLAVAFTSTSTGSITSYAWTFGDGTTSSLQNPSKTYTTAGSFTVGLTVTGPGGSHTATRTNLITVAGSPVSLASVDVLVDQTAAAGTVSNSNGILEPGETVLIAPVWAHTAGNPVTVSGTAQVSGTGSTAFTLPDSTAAYGTVSTGATVDCASATGNCYRLSVSSTVRRPALKWGVTFTETLSTGTVVSRTIPIGGSFSDVPPSYLFYPMIEAMVWNDITLGFLDGTYQPASGVSRWQTAMFLARSTAKTTGTTSLPVSGTVKGTPYNCVAGGVSAFGDIPPTDSGCTQLHFLAARNVNLSFECGGSNLACPNAATTRAAMAVLVAGAIATGGDAGVPSTGTFNDTGTARSYNCAVTGGGHFSDVPSSAAYCRHANYLWARGYIDGFADGTFQPQLAVSRGQMAKFLANALRLTLD